MSSRHVRIGVSRYSLFVSLALIGCGSSRAGSPDASHDAVADGARVDSQLLDAPSDLDARVDIDAPVSIDAPINIDAPIDAPVSIDAPSFGPDRVWFVADSSPVLHYDGTSVAPTTSATNTYYAIWGASATDVFALAWNGAVVRFDGTQWATSRASTSSTSIYYSIMGFSASDVWALGERGTILRFNGTSWSSTVNGTIGNWAATLWGTSSSNMWALGYSPNNHHWNGSQWSNLPYIPGIYPFAMWGSSASDIWAVGQTLDQGNTPDTSTIAHYNGTQWSLWPVPAELDQQGQVLRSVWGASATDVWAVGDDGLMAHWDGTSWTRVESGTTRDLNAVGGSWSGSVWAAGALGTILHRDASGTWSPIASGTTKSIYGLWVAPGTIIP